MEEYRLFYKMSQYLSTLWCSGRTSLMCAWEGQSFSFHMGPLELFFSYTLKNWSGVLPSVDPVEQSITCTT